MNPKYWLGAALALSLLGGASAWAQHDDHPGGGAPAGHPGGGAPGGGRPPAGGAPVMRAAPAAPAFHSAPPSGGSRGPFTRGAPAGGGPAGGAPTGGAHFSAQTRPGAPGGGSRPQYDRRAFPSVIRADHRYQWHGRAWSAPQGYYYRHWGYGDHLPSGWFGPQWYIDDYYDYDLPLPPYGYEWVRVGPDALLIDLSTGLVVESAYGIFY